MGCRPAPAELVGDTFQTYAINIGKISSVQAWRGHLLGAFTCGLTRQGTTITIISTQGVSSTVLRWCRNLNGHTCSRGYLSVGELQQRAPYTIFKNSIGRQCPKLSTYVRLR
jgi:hypothetical protein